MNFSTGVAKIRNYHRENGSYLSLVKIVDTARTATRSTILSRRFNAHHWLIGREPRIIGVGCIKIGDDFRCGRSLWLEAVTRYEDQVFQPSISIGRNVAMSDAVHISAISSILIGNDVLIGSHVHVSDHHHGSYEGDHQSNPLSSPRLRRLTSPGQTIIGNRVWLGNGVVVLPGTHIGNGAIIGANSVVSSDIEPDSMAVGAPARMIKKYDVTSAQWLRI